MAGRNLCRSLIGEQDFLMLFNTYLISQISSTPYKDAGLLNLRPSAVLVIQFSTGTMDPGAPPQAVSSFRVAESPTSRRQLTQLSSSLPTAHRRPRPPGPRRPRPARPLLLCVQLSRRQARPVRSLPPRLLSELCRGNAPLRCVCRAHHQAGAHSVRGPALCVPRHAAGLPHRGRLCETRVPRAKPGPGRWCGRWAAWGVEEMGG
jgi:hypothetical protein